MSTMSMELKYKKPSVFLLNMINQMAGEHTAYMRNAKAKAQAVIEQAKKEGLPNEQLRKLITESFKKAGLSDRTLRDALPAELKNPNMIRKKQVVKKEPLVNKWQIKFSLPEMLAAVEPLVGAGHKKGLIVHDNSRVLEVLYE